MKNIKIHYRNHHGGTNTTWQKTFKEFGELSLGPRTKGGFPEEIDHLHLGGSIKTHKKCTITVEELKEVQRHTNCSISMFFGDPIPASFKLHHKILDNVPKVKVYSAALYGTNMWRKDIIWVLHPLDKDVYYPVKHKLNNNTVLFSGSVIGNSYRKNIISKLRKSGIKVDVVGRGGNISPKFEKDFSELSKNYLISFGMKPKESIPVEKYASSRLANALAVGLIYIMPDYNLKDEFKKDELIQWHSVNDLIEKIKYYLKNPEEGLKISDNGRKRILNKWTFIKLVERFLKDGENI